MKKTKKLFLVLFSTLICQYSLAACSHTNFTNNLIDTIPHIEPEYKGNRIVVKSIKVIKKKGKSYKIQYKLVNNGRNKIKLGKSVSIPKDLIIQFDNSLVENNLLGAKNTIIESIKKQSVSIRPGQLIMGNKIKFSHRSIPPSDRIANKIEKDNPLESISEEEIVKKHTPKMEKSKEEILPFSELDIVEDYIAKEVLPAVDELKSPRNPMPSDAIQNSVKNKESHLLETILVKEDVESNKLEIEDAESILEVIPSEKSTNNFVKKSEIEIPEVVVIETPDTNSIEKIESQLSNEKLCADLTIENVEIIKNNKRYVFLKYIIKNIGNIPISLHGKTKKENDNIAIQSHLTRSHKLTRGSIPLDISFIKKGNRDIKGMISPGESVSLKLKIETSKVTRFTPVLALTLNPASTNFECNRFNNIFFIDIAGKAPEAKNSTPLKPSNDESTEKISVMEN